MSVLDLEQIDSTLSGALNSPENVMREIQSRVLSTIGFEVDRYLEENPEISEKLAVMETAKDELEKRTMRDIFTDMEQKTPLYAKIVESIEEGANIVIQLIQQDVRREIEAACGVLLSELENADLSEQAMTDGLTGLLQRRAFFEICSNVIQRIERGGHGNEAENAKPHLSALMMDLDNFKQINDTYGHPAGDQILVQLANRVKKVLARKSDVFARYGGEEFTALLPDTDGNGALKVADKILKAVNSEPFVINVNGEDLEINLTVSIGVGEYEGGNDTDGKKMVGKADQALYKAKRGGKNRVAN